jgi:hypothetical protein
VHIIMTFLQRPILLSLLLGACGSSGSTVGATDAQVADVRGTDAQVQGTDAQVQGTDAQVQGTDAQVQGTDAQVQGTDAQVQGTDAQAPGNDAGPDFCATPSPCPNDARLTPEDIMNWRTSLVAQRGQPCGPENNEVNACRAQNIACGADGMTDFTATSERFNMACMTLVMARETCCASPAGMGSPNCI